MLRPDPFLLSLHFNAPHWPWEAPGPDGEAESARIAAEPAPKLDDFDGGAQAVFAAMVERMDLQVGRVLDTLDRLGVAQDTIVVFTSDNGGERFADVWPFTGRKTELLEGGLRIPAILRWPARVAPGTTNSQVTISMDWLPTLTAAAGTGPDPSAPTDGMNLLPHLRPGAEAVPRELFWRYHSKDQKAVRDGNWKFLEILGNTFLFDVVADPLERANLKDRHPEVYARLMDQWKAWNATMLPFTSGNFSDAFSGAELADHFGAPPTIRGLQKAPR